MERDGHLTDQVFAGLAKVMACRFGPPWWHPEANISTLDSLPTPFTKQNSHWLGRLNHPEQMSLFSFGKHEPPHLDFRADKGLPVPSEMNKMMFRAGIGVCCQRHELQ